LGLRDIHEAKEAGKQHSVSFSDVG